MFELRFDGALRLVHEDEALLREEANKFSVGWDHARGAPKTGPNQGLAYDPLRITVAPAGAVLVRRNGVLVETASTHEEAQSKVDALIDEHMNGSQRNKLSPHSVVSKMRRSGRLTEERILAAVRAWYTIHSV